MSADDLMTISKPVEHNEICFWAFLEYISFWTAYTSSNWQERITLQLLVKVSHSLSLSFGDTGLSKLMENEERPLEQKGKQQYLPHHGIHASCSRIKKIKCFWSIFETFF